MKLLDRNIENPKELISLCESNIENFIGKNQNIIVQKFTQWAIIHVQPIVAPFEKFQYNGPQGLIMNNKINIKLLLQSYLFFQEVYNKYHAEAFSFIVRNRNTDEISVYIPHQVISGAIVTYSIDDEINEDYEILINLHSHHVMTISFSVTDDEDDKNQTTISGVLRNLKNDPLFDFRVWSINKFLNLSINDIFNTNNVNITLEEYLKYSNLFELLQVKYPEVDLEPVWMDKVVLQQVPQIQKKFISPVYYRGVGINKISDINEVNDLYGGDYDDGQISNFAE